MTIPGSCCNEARVTYPPTTFPTRKKAGAPAKKLGPGLYLVGSATYWCLTTSRVASHY
jgi:hypothetical protein